MEAMTRDQRPGANRIALRAIRVKAVEGVDLARLTAQGFHLASALTTTFEVFGASVTGQVTG